MSPMEDGVPPPDIASNAMLVESARHGSAAAKEALFRRYAPMVNGLALRLLGRDADVDDLVQETFLQAFGSLEGLKEPSIFGSWIASIVVHTAHKLLRRRRLLVQLGLRRRDPIDVDALLAPTAPPEVVLEVRSIYEVIDDLPPKLRIPLLLRRAEGLELAEIAELTGASLATVKRRLAEAEERLRAAPTLRRRP